MSTNGFTPKALETILRSPAARNPLVKRLATALRERIVKDEEVVRVAETVRIVVRCDKSFEVFGSERVNVIIESPKKPLTPLASGNQIELLPLAEREPLPAADEPGTLNEQYAAVTRFIDDPQRRKDREAAWARARQECLEHLQDRTE